MLNPDELPLNERKNQIGLIYVEAVAAMAGYCVATLRSDYDSIDVQLKSRVGRKNQLEFQVKCSSLIVGENSEFAFRLRKKNYDDLRADTLVPRYLLVVVMPRTMGDWMRQSERRMNLRRCGYWTSLLGLPERINVATVTVKVPRANHLTPTALQLLMDRGISPISSIPTLSEGER